MNLIVIQLQSIRRGLEFIKYLKPKKKMPDSGMIISSNGTNSSNNSLDERDYLERALPEQERDYSDWMDRYQNSPEREPEPEYPFHDFNYGP
jgi:hypothetical protein